MHRNEQFAFRQDQSTTFQLLNYSDGLITDLNQKEKTAEILLDIELSFDLTQRPFTLSSQNGYTPWYMKNN